MIAEPSAPRAIRVGALGLFSAGTHEVEKRRRKRAGDAAIFVEDSIISLTSVHNRSSYLRISTWILK
jgi:hypothetical protein